MEVDSGLVSQSHVPIRRDNVVRNNGFMGRIGSELEGKGLAS